MINLNEKRNEVFEIASELFEKFTNMPKTVRTDEKERTGVQVVVWEPGTRNLIMVSVGEPSEAARFLAVEKAVRANAYADGTSSESEVASLNRFAGALSIFWDFGETEKGQGRSEIFASTSGLKSEEDVAISIAVLAKITGKKFSEICDIIFHCDGQLPTWYDSGNRSYFGFLFEELSENEK